MCAQIHPTAIVEEGAQLAESVVVGAFACIGAEVSLGEGTEVQHHATVEGKTTMGPHNTVHPYAYIGAQTQDLKYAGGKPGLKIGSHNRFREYCTVHCATRDGEYTVMGDHNYCLAFSHVSHDCQIGNHTILGHNSTFGGHLIVEDYVTLGGHSATHPFVRLGRDCYIGGMTKITQDVLPYMIAEGVPAQTRTINKVGLERHGYKTAQIQFLRHCYKIVYRQGLNHSQAVEQLREEATHLEDANTVGMINHLIEFIETSERGITPATPRPVTQMPFEG